MWRLAPSPSLVGAGSAPSASHTSHVLRRSLLLAMLLATVGSAACGPAAPAGPRAIDGAFPAQGDIAALPVRVTDLPRVISTVSVVAANAGHEGVIQVPGRDDALYLQWIGGMCDRGAEVVVDRAGTSLVITISTERDFGGCRMAGIGRTLMLELREPIDATTVALRLLD
jgi:hypothetical protein